MIFHRSLNVDDAELQFDVKSVKCLKYHPYAPMKIVGSMCSFFESDEHFFLVFEGKRPFLLSIVTT